MTAAVGERRAGGRKRGRGEGALLRAGLWLLHVMVVGVAVFSVVTGRFDFWLDVRWLGASGVLLEIVWVGATLIVPWCVGPMVRGWVGKSRWMEGGWAPAWGVRLLWPTYGILACLVADCVFYVVLLREGRVDLMVPMPAVMAAVLGAWVLLVREWARRGARGERVLLRRRQWGMGAVAAVVVVAMGGAFFLHGYARPPAGKVDVAVVLGGRVNRDGTASVQLRERVRAAVWLYQRGLAGHIVLSGGNFPAKRAEDAEMNELKAMKDVCDELGVPEAAVTIDPVGINTRATAYNAVTLMREKGWRSVAACSTGFHLFRTGRSFAELGGAEVACYTVAAAPEWKCADLRDTLRELAANVVYATDRHYREPKAMAMRVSEPRVVVRKGANRVELLDGDKLIKAYTCITGGNTGDKLVEGDRKTPVGKFRIVYKNPQSKFHLSLGLDYPNREDADRGLAAGLITRAEYAGILEALASDLSLAENQKKLWYTKLGGEIFLHGYGTGRTGTAGCVAFSNADIEELYALLPVGTAVEILP